MNLKTFAAVAVAASFALVGLPAAAAPLEIAGSTTVQKSIIEPVGSRAKEVTGVEIKMLGVGTGKGMQMLFDGKVSVAAISDELAEAVAAAKKAGAANAPANLKMVTVLKAQ